MKKLHYNVTLVKRNERNKIITGTRDADIIFIQAEKRKTMK